MNAHLDDARLDEYLDEALTPAERAGIDAHLAGCPACAARVVSRRTLFADLSALPDAPLSRDLAAAVTAQLSPRRAPVLRPALRWAFVVQAALAGALLALAGPWLAALGLPDWAAEALAGAADLWARFPAAFAEWWLARVTPLPALVASAGQGLSVEAGPLEITLLLASAAALGLLGNGLLLYSTRASRRPS